MLWFGLFERAEKVDPSDFLPDPAGAWAGRARPLVTEAEYRRALAQVLEHILAGDIYRANLTFQAEVAPPAIRSPSTPRCASVAAPIVFTGAHWILSLSPELFFTLDGGRVTTRPMKGRRRRTPIRPRSATTPSSAPRI